MLTAAIYARYSSDRQRATSIDDQIALCHQAALGGLEGRRRSWMIFGTRLGVEWQAKCAGGSAPAVVRTDTAASLFTTSIAKSQGTDVLWTLRKPQS